MSLEEFLAVDSMFLDEIKNIDYFSVREHPDKVKRLSYMKAFAYMEDAAAQYDLGMLCAFGEDGVEKDWEMAKKLLHKAADGNVSDAMAFLSIIYMEEMAASLIEAWNKEESEEEYYPKVDLLFNKGAKNLARALTCCNELALKIYTGAMKKDWNQGEFRKTLLEKTNFSLQSYVEELRIKNDGWSNYVLGVFSLRGIGVMQDVEQARKYFLRGAELGDFSSKQELKNPLFMLDEDE